MQTLKNYPVDKADTLKVSALHALAYCPRLFYLEEEDWEDLYLVSEELGLRGRVDALKTRDGQTIPYEHKRGRCYRDENKLPQGWESDQIQILAYCCLIESALGITVTEGRIRYHADNTLIHVPFNEEGRQKVKNAIQEAQSLLQAQELPPVTENERLCGSCSLSPVCLPEEARLAHNKEWQPVRLFPKDDERQVLHILEAGTLVGRTGEQLKITRKGQPPEKLAVNQVGQVVLHSFSQISTQALHFLADQKIGVHWISGGGRYVGSFDLRQGSIQRRIEQYQALSQPDFCLKLAQKLVACRGGGQRKFLMRGKRNLAKNSVKLERNIDQMKALLKQVPQANSLDSLLGIEGKLAALYFGALPCLIGQDVPPEMNFCGRNRRPPKDRFNCLLSFGYALLIKDVMNAILTVGLEPSFGFYHQPRTQASPLALDLMEIFRVPLVDMIVLASVNRGQWHPQEDFEVRGNQVWLNDSGRRKFVSLYEERKEDSWKHPVTGYSLTYRRLLELEVRLLEKEWMGEGGLFGQLVLR
jgi:CRISP-associated protein Cas1